MLSERGGEVGDLCEIPPPSCWGYGYFQKLLKKKKAHVLPWPDAIFFKVLSNSPKITQKVLASGYMYIILNKATFFYFF